MLSALAGLLDRRPWHLLAVALAITAVAAPLGIDVREHLKPRGFDVPGSDSARARALIAQASGTDPANGVLAVIRLPATYGTPASLRAIRAAERKLRRDRAVVAVLDAANTHNPAMVANDRRSTYVIAATRPLSDEQQEAAGKRLLAAFDGDRHVTLGGNPVANQEISKTIEGDLRRAELLAVPLIVVLSFFIFRGFVASLLAPIAGGITVTVSFFLLRELASLTSLSIYALNLVTGLSIGLSIDWSLLLLSRYREERGRTPDLRLALRHAFVPAGRTIFFSAVTVAASLATLLVFPLRFLRSMGYGGLVASGVAMLVALVVLPTLLRLLGPNIDALTPRRWRDPERLARPSGLWRSLGTLVTNHPVPVATIVLVFTIAVATPIARVRWRTVDASSLPASAQAYQADRTINHSREFVPNSGTPFYIVLAGPRASARKAAAVAERARQLRGVLAVPRPRYLGRDTWRIDLITGHGPYSATTQDVVRKLSGLERDYPLVVGGDAAAFRDERGAIGRRLPIALALLAVTTLTILFLLSGSLVAPVLALLMNGITLAAAFGALVLIFEDGRFEGLLDFTSQGALDLTIPLVLAALVFAISTDYGVFLLSRVREARLEGHGDRDAVRGSVARVGRIVTSAAVLFAVSIGVFGTSNIVVLKILGIGTALSVLADAVFIRCLLYPAILTLLGHKTWWLPSQLARSPVARGGH
jgi:putative drug exporter of the RND superfamily